MSEEAQEEEPSIEEILDSIRQIISEDDEEGGEGEGAPASTEVAAAEPEAPASEADAEPVADPVPESEPEPEASAEEESVAAEPDDVLELTEKVEEDQPPAAPDPEPAGEPMEIDMMDSDDTVATPDPVPEPVESAEPSAPADESDILTQTAEHAAYDGFSELAKATAVEIGGVTVEEIVRTELRPLLRDWLDKHLPNMIERLVQEELEKISKRATDE